MKIDYSNKTILITGGTGSFGNAVTRKMIDLGVGEIRIFSRDEKKQDDMRNSFKSEKIKFIIGDVRDFGSLRDSMYGVDLVFHAAALKQVPSCEFFPLEAVKTNILGTENVLNAAIEENVEKVVCLSTDKAAYPINAMGISKAMMEKVFIAKSRSVKNKRTIICGTRYGNVMGSRGSVIPLFIEQIKNNTEMTLTNPSMTRFLMTINEAVNLVEFAFQNGNQGDLFIQKSPSSTIGDLAIALCELFEIEPKIKIIGTRHGEKRFETLMTQEEALKAVDLGNYYKIPVDQRSLYYDKYFSEGNVDIDKIESYNSDNTEILNIEQIKSKLMELPELKMELSRLSTDGDLL